MSYCITGSCLAHRRRVFLQEWGPDAGLWCHSDGWPCEPLPGSARATASDQREHHMSATRVTRPGPLTWPVAGSDSSPAGRRSGPEPGCGLILAATATGQHVHGGVLLLAAAIGVAAWLIRSWLWPFSPCRGCKGSGKNIGSTGRRYGTHRRCKGTGRRVRFGARMVRRAIGRKRQ